MDTTFKLTPAQPSPSFRLRPGRIGDRAQGYFARPEKPSRCRMLAAMDDRMLADIGLTRSDLRDAYAEPLWRDPTDMLAGRAREKRRYRPRRRDGQHISAPSIAPAQCYAAPRTDRATRYTIEAPEAGLPSRPGDPHLCASPRTRGSSARRPSPAGVSCRERTASCSRLRGKANRHSQRGY